ncbi:MAG TPA: glycosyltransferase family 87 protein [Terriglobales bacterium]|nr:glycosyltransferase family 87 protein [Terriglobales bacterium]
MSVREEQDQEFAIEEAFPSKSVRKSEILPKLFIAFFVQLVMIVGVSLITQFGPVFVVRFFFGLDYFDFYVAAQDWLHHVDPYLRGRLYTPPSSILVGLLLEWLPFESARLIVFVLNVSLIYYSLRALARHFGLSRRNEFLLLGTAATFYPFYFLIERGNLDGIMLALLVFGFASRHWLVRSLLLGASMAVKVYSGLLFVVMLLRKRSWKVIGAGALVFALMQIPFLPLVSSFLHAIGGRSGLFRIDENISPAALIMLLFLGKGPWKIVFFGFWAATLIYRLLRDRGGNLTETWPVYVPWMISCPVVVYPYSGVLALALVALVAAACQKRAPTNAEKTVLVGFGLLGFQAVAWTTYLYPLIHTAILLHVTCAVGTSCMIAGACRLPLYGEKLPT